MTEKDLMTSSIESELKTGAQVLVDTASLAEQIAESADLLIRALAGGGKVLVCGNGGSAAAAQHFAAELTVRFELERNALPGLSLTTDTSVLTAGANDYAYDVVFRRQVEAWGRLGDALVGLTTSGDSRNVLESFAAAKAAGLTTICLTGNGGGEVADQDLDALIIVPSDRTRYIQEAHTAIIHAWCARIDEAFSNGDFTGPDAPRPAA